MPHKKVAADHISIRDWLARVRSATPSERSVGTPGNFGSVPDAMACMPSTSALPACPCIKASLCAVQKSLKAFE